MSTGEAPPKFITENGVRKMNPAWKAWNQQQQAQQQAQAGATTHVNFVPQMTNMDTALPVVTSIQDQQRHLQGAQMAESVQAAHEMLQDDDIAASLGGNPQNVMDQLNQVFAKYEVPMGLVNKLMGVSDFQYMEFIVDDSGSMNSATDSVLPNGQPMTRWQEVHKRLITMFEVLSIVPIPPAYIRFLNRQDVIEIRRGDGEPSQAFYVRIQSLLGASFQRPPAGTTPAKERIAESLGRCQGQSMIRYFFGDGEPNGGETASRAITQMLINRPNPHQNPFTFMSCTDEDEACEWMRECEEAAPFCSEFDDYADEQREVIADQGKAFSYSYGLFLVSCICAAFNPTDLDALDEAAPLTKTTLDNLFGYVLNPQEYQYYFDHFIQAQAAKPVETALDKLQKDYLPFWQREFQQFLAAPVANQLEVVKAYNHAVKDLKARGL
jgi:hypothetical protein